jgi:hypothetical protein
MDVILYVCMLIGIGRKKEINGKREGRYSIAHDASDRPAIEDALR